MKQTRRNFLKFAGISAAGLALAPAASLASSGGTYEATPASAIEEAGTTRWSMVVDTRALNTEEAIATLQHACHSTHNVPSIPTKQDVKWIWSAPYKEAFPEQENNHMSEAVEERRFALLCNHCDNPPCVRVCPTQATFKRPDGIVAMDYHRCIGCRYCMAGCPYGARSFNFMEPRIYLDPAKLNPEFPTRMRGVVEKCNFCVERLADGKQPACVEAADGALTFGNLHDSGSEVRKVLRENFTIRRKPSVGTEPGVYYII